jgi:hypothetical protein
MIGSALGHQRGMSGPNASAVFAMARRTRGKPAFGQALVIDRRGIAEIAKPGRGRYLRALGIGHWHRSIIGRHRKALLAVQPTGEPAHLGMAALPIGEETQLAHQIARIHGRDAGHQVPVTASVQPMAGMARCLRSGITARQRN